VPLGMPFVPALDDDLPARPGQGKQLASAVFAGVKRRLVRRRYQPVYGGTLDLLASLLWLTNACTKTVSSYCRPEAVVVSAMGCLS
jgi:hypothetical protein